MRCIKVLQIRLWVFFQDLEINPNSKIRVKVTNCVLKLRIRNVYRVTSHPFSSKDLIHFLIDSGSSEKLLSHRFNS